MRAIGTDVSHWQGVINWQTMYSQGIRFAFIKATQGNGDYKDADHFTNMVNAAAKGILTAPYHFYDKNDDPAGQAKFFKDNSQPGILPPVLDIEKPPLSQVVTMIATGEIPKAKAARALLQVFTGNADASHVKATVLAIESQFGRKPLLYSNLDSWKNWVVGDKAWAWAYSLWIAGYWYSKWYEWLITYLNDKNPILPVPFAVWDFWQFTAYAPGPKYGAASASLDLNFFNGDEAALKAKYGIPPNPIPPPVNGEPILRYTNPNPVNIRETANNNLAKVGTLPAGSIVTALEVRFTDSNSAWVRFSPNPEWLTKTVPEYWIAGIHDGQGPLLQFVPAL